MCAFHWDEESFGSGYERILLLHVQKKAFYITVRCFLQKAIPIIFSYKQHYFLLDTVFSCLWKLRPLYYFNYGLDTEYCCCQSQHGNESWQSGHINQTFSLVEDFAGNFNSGGSKNQTEAKKLPNSLWLDRLFYCNCIHKCSWKDSDKTLG